MLSQDEINQNNSSIQDPENEEDENQSSLHSRLIEDLLGDGDQTEGEDLNSLKTTVVHTP